MSGKFLLIQCFAERYRSAASVAGAERAQARSVTDMLVGSSAWFGVFISGIWPFASDLKQSCLSKRKISFDTYSDLRF